jgi:hypothetical protein
MIRTLFLLVIFTFAACSSVQEKQVIGAWKEVEKDKRSRRTATLLITEKILTIGSDSVPITLLYRDNKVFVMRFGDNQSVIKTLELIDKDTMISSDLFVGKVKYIRTTEADIQAIRAAESK